MSYSLNILQIFKNQTQFPFHIVLKPEKNLNTAQNITQDNKKSSKHKKGGQCACKMYLGTCIHEIEAEEEVKNDFNNNHCNTII